MVGPYYWRWGHGSSQGGASIVDNNSISVLSSWWADYIHRQRHCTIHCSAGSLVSVMLWWTIGPKWVVVQHGGGRHVDQQCKAGCAQCGKVTYQLGKVCPFVFTFSVHIHSLWTYILVDEISWAALSPLSSTRALNKLTYFFLEKFIWSLELSLNAVLVSKMSGKKRLGETSYPDSVEGRLEFEKEWLAAVE